MAGNTLENRAIKFGKVNSGLNIISMEMSGKNIGWENPNLPSVPTSDTEFINAWLRPDFFDAYWANKGSKATPDELDKRLAEILGASLYSKVSSTCAELGLRPYLYSRVLAWSQNEYDILEPKIRDLIKESCLITVRQAIKLRETSVASLNAFVKSLSKKATLDSFTQDLAMYISLRQVGPLLDVAGLREALKATTIVGDLVWTSEKWQKSKLQEACSSDNAPKFGWQHYAWNESLVDSPYKNISEVIVKHLDVKTSTAARALLIMKTPLIGLISDLFTVWEIADTLFQDDKNRKVVLQNKINLIIKKQTDSIFVLEKEFKRLEKTNDWSLYAPVIKYVIAGYRYHGFRGPIVDKFESDAIPKPTATLMDHSNLVLTVTGITLAFFPPAAFVGVLLGGASLIFGVAGKIMELNDARQDNETRATIIAGKPASAQALDLVEKPRSTEDIETALAVELLFGMFAVKGVKNVVIDAKNVLKNFFVTKFNKPVVQTAKFTLKNANQAEKLFDPSTMAATTNKKATIPNTKTMVTDTRVHPSKQGPASTAIVDPLNVDKKGVFKLNKKPIADKDADALLDFVNDDGVKKRFTSSTSKNQGAVEADIARRKALQNRHAEAEKRNDMLQTQRSLQETAPRYGETKDIDAQIRWINNELQKPKLTSAERRSLKQLKSELNDKLDAFKSLKVVRAATGVRHDRIAQELEKAGADLAKIRQAINQERVTLTELQLRINKLSGQAKEDALKKIDQLCEKIDMFSEVIGERIRFIQQKIKALQHYEGGKAILEELTKRGILIITTDSDYAPEITLYGEFISLN